VEPAFRGRVQPLRNKEPAMAWTRPIVVEIPAGMEVTAYQSAEFEPRG
jgi:coenzyme PQQ precursor peptide PqqA